MFSIINKNKLYRYMRPTGIDGVVVMKPINELIPRAFSDSNAKGVRFVWLNDDILEIPDYCFYNADVEYVRISPKTKRIGDCAFKNCKNLVSVKVPEGCLVGTKRWDGTVANTETVFDGCPKLRTKWAPWIDCVKSEWSNDVPAGMAIFFEGGFLTSTTDKNKWANQFICDTGFLISPEKGFYRVIDINPLITKRNPSGYIAKTRIIEVKA